MCKVDGANWRSVEVVGRFYDNTINQGAKFIYLEFRNGSQAVDFVINSPYKTGTILLNQNTSSYPNSLRPKDYAAFIKEYSNLAPTEEYLTNDTDVGTIDISLVDSIDQKIKASFSFTGKDQLTGKKVLVGEGYFDYHQ